MTRISDRGLQGESFIAIALRRARRGSGSTARFRAQRTWTLPVRDLRGIIRRTPFAVIGGVATRLYMPERTTLDLDILVAAQDAAQLADELRNGGCQYEGPLSAGGSHWTLPDGKGLDVLESEAAWVPAALATSRRAPDGLPVVDLPYLVLMKLESGRTQDLADVSRMLGAASQSDLAPVRDVVGRHFPEAAQDLESLIELGRREADE